MCSNASRNWRENSNDVLFANNVQVVGGGATCRNTQKCAKHCPSTPAIERTFRLLSYASIGLVVRPLELTLAELEALPQRKLTDDFICLEGWTAPAVKWQGVGLESVLTLAGVNPEAKWVQASAAEFERPRAFERCRCRFARYSTGRECSAHGPRRSGTACRARWRLLH